MPFNLLELFYGFLWSPDYGVGAATGQRYQVTRSDRFDDLNTYLFSPIHEVHLRDSASGAWAGTLGGETAGLYRT